MRLDEEFTRAAKKMPHQIAMIGGGRYLTCREMDQDSPWRFGTPAPHPVEVSNELSPRFFTEAIAAMKAGKIAAHGKAFKTHTTEYNDGACLLFTSGSTGSSKAIVHSHDTWLKLVEADQDAYQLRPAMDRINISRRGAAAYRWGFLGLLSHVPIVIGNPTAEFVNRNLITILNLHATQFRELMVSGEKFPLVRIVNIGGEMVDWGDHELYKSRFKDDCQFVCRYGLSEGVVAAEYRVDKAASGQGRMPVGYPLRDVRLQVVDGEIWVSSPYLAIEYWDDPELTAEKFVRDPDGTHWYKTGDLGQLDEKGVLHHEGRKTLSVQGVGEDVSNMAGRD